MDSQGEEGMGTPLDQAEAGEGSHWSTTLYQPPPCSEQLLRSVSAGMLEVWGTEG